MRFIILLGMLISLNSFGQRKNFIIGVNGDTLNVVDAKGLKQGKWVIRLEKVRGEPGYEDEGMYKDDKKESTWRRYTLIGDLIAVENFRWGNKNGPSQYFNGYGELLREESWKAINPDKIYDTIDVEDVDKPGNFKEVIVKNDGAGIRHGMWKYYDPVSGLITRTENYVLGSLEGKKKDPLTASATTEKKSTSKPQEVLDFEKKHAGKKKIRVKDGSTGF